MLTINRAIRTGSGIVAALLPQTALLAAVVGVMGAGLYADSQVQSHSRPPASGSLVIQGRITDIQGALVMVKMPDSYPSTEGVHGHYVVAGRALNVDISHARVLLPDGTQVDKRPLQTGEYVLMVLSGPEMQPASRGAVPNLSQTYSATIVERLVQGDRVVTH